jgi:signal transduction histidine kinase
MCGIPEGHGWVNFAHDDTKQSMLQQWSQFLTTDQRTIELETFWSNNRWVLLTAAKLYTISGATRGVIGCGIDITERKLNDTLQAQRIVEAEKRRAEAEEARLQQELLIDITSHEIRNPISSLRQCSSMVRNNLLELQDQLKTTVASQTLFEVSPQLLLTMDEDLEALDSIYQCGLAQERISNDVLSLGKMQLDLLRELRQA